MTVSPSIPATIEIKRSRLFGGAVAVAAIAAAVTWALLTFATGSASTVSNELMAAPSVQLAESYGSGMSHAGMLGTPHGASNSYASRIAKLTRLQQAAAFGGPGATLSVLYGLTPKEAMYVRGITSMTPEQQAAAFGGH